MRDLTGLIFNRLTVLGSREERLVGANAQKKLFWLCRCSCDAKTEKVISGAHLINGHTKSCGCIGKEQLAIHNIEQRGIPNYKNRKASGVAARNDLLGRYKASARFRKYEWDLTEEQFDVLVKSNCFFCGVEPAREIKRAGGSFFYNGIDRLENEPYYRAHNSVACCWDCNSRKRSWGLKKFLAWVERVHEHQKMMRIASSSGISDERNGTREVCSTIA